MYTTLGCIKTCDKEWNVSINSKSSGHSWEKGHQNSINGQCFEKE
jgi:hypothetical protein